MCIGEQYRHVSEYEEEIAGRMQGAVWRASWLCGYRVWSALWGSRLPKSRRLRAAEFHEYGWLWREVLECRFICQTTELWYIYAIPTMFDFLFTEHPCVIFYGLALKWLLWFSKNNYWFVLRSCLHLFTNIAMNTIQIKCENITSI